MLLGIDIGTYASKGVITDCEGRTLADVVIPHGVEHARPEWAEQDAETVWWGDAKKAIRALLDKAGASGRDVAGVGCAGMTPCLVPLDEQGRPLRRGILYGIDRRSGKQIQWLLEHVGEERIFSITCNALSTQAAGAKILWLRENEPHVFSATRKFVGAMGYVVSRLTGEFTISPMPATRYDPFYNMRAGRWDQAMCEACDLSPEVLPRIGQSHEVAGTVTRQAAEETGLSPGTPVVFGVGDALGEMVGAGAIHPGDGIILYGSTSALRLCVKDLTPDRRLYATPHCTPGGWTIDGAPASAGSILRWFHERIVGQPREGLDDEAGRLPPGAGGLVCLPYFEGERTPLHDPDARGLLLGLHTGHTAAHMHLALMEGTAFAIRHILDIIEELAERPRKVYASGGGSGSVWAQVMSDVTGLTQHVCAFPHGAARGAAYLAGMGAGLFKTFDGMAGAWQKTARVVEPRAERKTAYEQYYGVYKSLYASTKEAMHALARLGRGHRFK